MLCKFWALQHAWNVSKPGPWSSGGKGRILHRVSVSFKSIITLQLQITQAVLSKSRFSPPVFPLEGETTEHLCATSLVQNSKAWGIQHFQIVLAPQASSNLQLEMVWKAPPWSYWWPFQPKKSCLYCLLLGTKPVRSCIHVSLLWETNLG